ncbi:MAG: rod shape-determining protein MreD [Desulfobacteraceae bacterium]|nr:rod shape-determining protein MreD [Desulfobacteraceae bacterium]MBC2718581.1 rod shape-determining protein MreD [Desulfobacteraceae bacterium]
MTYCFYICVCLCLVIFQTTIIPHISLFNNVYDLLIPFIIYLGLFRPAREGILFTLVSGFLMDNLSGGPFGLYLTTYFWLFIVVKLVIKYLHARNNILLLLIVAAGVLMENIIFIASSTMARSDSHFFAITIKTVFFQILWAGCTGFFFITFFNHIHKKLEQWFNGLIRDWGIGDR